MYHQTVNPIPFLPIRWFPAALLPLTLLLLTLVPALPAQDTTAEAGLASASPVDPRAVGQAAQTQFENFRRENLPGFRGNKPRECQEQVGRFCYWYDENAAASPPEPARISEARDRLLGVLDSLGRANPADNWISGQRVRYRNEAGRHDDALAVARECQSYGWWCDALTGFALHALGRYTEAEADYEKVLAAMRPRERCTWRDLTPYLDDDTRREYSRTTCGEPARVAYEDRVWWLSRTRYGLKGNDSRTEHFARLTYVEFLRDAPTAFMFGFDESEREMLVRFGWPVAWARGPDNRVPPGQDPSLRINVISSEATPAHRFIPPYYVLASPAVSDSIYWAVQRPPVVARYHPPYASKILMLEHQQALFRRGDTALVVLAYDVSKVNALKGATLGGALVLTPGTEPRAYETILRDVPARGTMTVRAPWGPLLMSAEIEAESASILVRARYGIHPPYGVGARVVLSDLLFYTPYGTFPTSVEEVLPHAIPTQKVRAGEPLGVYWEAYNTNPVGERMTISLTVVPETEASTGWLARGARALRLTREAEPVSLTVEDMSARGSRVSPRAVQLNISTLPKGEYLVQLEISVAGQYVIRADRRIVVTGP